MRFSFTWSNVETPVALQIHKGAKGKAGSTEIVLFSKPPVTHSGCRNTSTSLVKAIQKKRSTYYVSAQTDKYPNGALRARL